MSIGGGALYVDGGALYVDGGGAAYVLPGVGQKVCDMSGGAAIIGSPPVTILGICCDILGDIESAMICPGGSAADGLRALCLARPGCDRDIDMEEKEPPEIGGLAATIGECAT